MATARRCPAFATGRTLYTTGDGYYYFCNSHKQNKLYLRCSDKRCKVRASMRRNLTKLRPHGPHCHPPDPLLEEENKLKRRILRAAERESDSLKAIYARECASFPEEVWRRLNYTKLESTMYKARKKMQPPVPRSLEDYGRLLEEPQYYERYALTEDGRSLYRGVLGEKGDHCVVFVSDALAEVLAGSQWWFVDYGMGVRPVSPPSAQLLLISALYKEHLYPAIFVLMERKTLKAYQTVCEHIKSWIDDRVPGHIVTDFDATVQEAFREAFPTSKVQGAWYYYAQWLTKQVVGLGLQAHLCESMAARAVVKMCMVLPLLDPDNLFLGLEACLQYARTQGQAELLAPLLSALQQDWLAPHVSVHGCMQRSNNHMENYKRHFRKRMGLHCKNPWAFTDALRAEERVCRLDLTRTRNGMCVTRTRRARWLLEEGKVMGATVALDCSKISVFKFLQRASAAVNPLLNKALFHRRSGTSYTFHMTQAGNDVFDDTVEDEKFSNWKFNLLAGEDLLQDEDFLHNEDLLPSEYSEVETTALGGEEKPKTCMVCGERQPNVLLQPCNDMPACCECWEQWQCHSDTCPVCGQEAHGSITVLLPEQSPPSQPQ